MQQVQRWRDDYRTAKSQDEKFHVLSRLVWGDYAMKWYCNRAVRFWTGCSFDLLAAIRKTVMFYLHPDTVPKRQPSTPPRNKTPVDHDKDMQMTQAVQSSVI